MLKFFFLFLVLYVIGCYALAVPIGKRAYRDKFISKNDVEVFIAFSPFAIPIYLFEALITHASNKITGE